VHIIACVVITLIALAFIWPRRKDGTMRRKRKVYDAMAFDWVPMGTKNERDVVEFLAQQCNKIERQLGPPPNPAAYHYSVSFSSFSTADMPGTLRYAGSVIDMMISRRKAEREALDRVRAMLREVIESLDSFHDQAVRPDVKHQLQKVIGTSWPKW